MTENKAQEIVNRMDMCLAGLQYTATPKDVAWGLSKAISRMGKLSDKFNAERTAIEQSITKCREGMKRSQFQSAEEFDKACLELHETSVNQVKDLRNKIAALTPDELDAISGKEGSSKTAKIFSFKVGEQVVKSDEVVKGFVNSKHFLEVFNGDCTFEDGVVLYFQDKDLDAFTKEHEDFAKVLRTITKSLRSKFRAPKQAKKPGDPSRPRKRSSKPAPSA